MNSNTLKINGTAEIPQSLEIGFDYVIAGKLSVTSIEKIDCENGEFEYCHKGKLIAVELADKLGKTYKGVAKGSQSQKMRAMIINRYGSDEYPIIMGVLLENLDLILDTYIK